MVVVEQLVFEGGRWQWEFVENHHNTSARYFKKTHPEIVANPRLRVRKLG